MGRPVRYHPVIATVTEGIRGLFPVVLCAGLHGYCTHSWTQERTVLLYAETMLTFEPIFSVLIRLSNLGKKRLETNYTNSFKMQ
jgi:hypothetical protein